MQKKTICDRLVFNIENKVLPEPHGPIERRWSPFL